MNKKFRLVLLMLLGLAFGNVYADNERVVIYEHSFDQDGMGTTWTGNSSQQTYWYYDSSSNSFVGNTENLSNNQTVILSNGVSMGGNFYKDIKIEVETPENLKSEYFHFVIKDKFDNWQKIEASEYSYNNSTGKATITLEPAKYMLIVGFRMTKNIKNVIYKIHNIKVTGILAYNTNNPIADYTTDNMSDIYLYPEGSIVHLTGINQAIVVCSGASYACLNDNNGGVVLESANAKLSGIPYIGDRLRFNGDLYGIISKRYGATELIGVSLNATEYSSLTHVPLPKEINEDDYWNHIGELVIMPFSSEIEIWDKFNIKYSGPKTEIIQPDNLTSNYRVVGVIFTTADNKKRLLHTQELQDKIIFFSANTGVDLNADCIGQFCYVARNFKANTWHSLVLPFDITGSYGGIAEFVSAEDGSLNFQRVTTQIPAGTPFLFNPGQYWDSEYLTGFISLDHSTAQIINGNEYNFVGTFNDVQPNNGSYYLTEGNTIKPLSSGGTIKGFRAYFEPATPAAARTRSISLNIDGQTTAISDVIWGDEPNEGEAIYDLKGQYVGNNKETLRKGVYVINGKKFIK